MTHDTSLVGLLLEPLDYSVRKRQRKNPKFYFFDIGIKRALEKSLTRSVAPKSYEYGQAFEHFLVTEIHRLNQTFKKDCSFSYLRTKDDAEIDLIVERPGMPLALVEIKSKDRVDERDCTTLRRFSKDFARAQPFLLSNDPIAKKIGSVVCLHWQEGIAELGF
jgi:predicted AAA+ superfamily ATPase